MPYTLQQALIPTALQNPVILALMALLAIVTTIYTLKSQKARNFWMGNRGIVALLFLVVFFLVGSTLQIPEWFYGSLNLVTTLGLLPVLIAGAIAVGAGPKGKPNYCKS